MFGVLGEILAADGALLDFAPPLFQRLSHFAGHERCVLLFVPSQNHRRAPHGNAARRKTGGAPFSLRRRGPLRLAQHFRRGVLVVARDYFTVGWIDRLQDVCCFAQTDSSLRSLSTHNRMMTAPFNGVATAR